MTKEEFLRVKNAKWSPFGGGYGQRMSLKAIPPYFPELRTNCKWKYCKSLGTFNTTADLIQILDKAVCKK